MAKILARLDALGTVAELIREKSNIDDEWHPDFLATLIDVTAASPAVEVGWVKQPNGSFAAPAPFVPTPLQRLQAAITVGVEIVSTGTPAISGTYGIASQDEINLVGLQAGIAAGAPWLGGYRDQAGVKHAMTAAQFTTLATAILGYLEALDEAYAAAAGGGAWSPPTTPVTIA